LISSVQNYFSWVGCNSQAEFVHAGLTALSSQARLCFEKNMLGSLYNNTSAGLKKLNLLTRSHNSYKNIKYPSFAYLKK